MTAVFSTGEFRLASIRSSARDRQASLFQVRLAARAAVAQYRSGRREQAVSLRQMLRAKRAHMQAELATLRNARRRTLKAAPTEIARAAPVLTEARPRPLPPPVTVLELLPPAPFPRGSTDNEQRVLQTIRAHPEGIWLVDIGNEFGVDWRSLNRVVQKLLDSGRVAQLDQRYFPIGQ